MPLTLNGAVGSRSYSTLSAIEDDAFLSRIWGGIHVRGAMDDAYLVGHEVAARLWRPNHSPGTGPHRRQPRPGAPHRAARLPPAAYRDTTPKEPYPNLQADGPITAETAAEIYRKSALALAKRKVVAFSVSLRDWEWLRGSPAYAWVGGLRAPVRRRLGSDIARVVDAGGVVGEPFRPGDRVYGDPSAQ